MNTELSHAESPKPSKASVFCATFRDRYDALVEQAREVQRTTDTPAWMDLYATELRRHQSVEANALKAIIENVIVMRRDGSNEDGEKMVRDQARALTEERERFWAWRAASVFGFSRFADDCRRIKDECLNSARQAERDSPLHDAGLAHEVAVEMQAWPLVQWSDEYGTLSVG